MLPSLEELTALQSRRTAQAQRPPLGEAGGFTVGQRLYNDIPVFLHLQPPPHPDVVIQQRADPAVTQICISTPVLPEQLK